MRKTLIAWAVGSLVLCASAAYAQDELGGSGGADIELGATDASDVEMGIETQGSRRLNARPGGSRGGGLRLGLQLRLNAANVLEFNNVVGNGLADSNRVPVVTPGVRLVDGKLFVGAGFGFNGYSLEAQNGDEESRSGFAFSPLGSFDVLSSSAAALSVLAWLNFASLGETENCDGDCTDANDDAFGWGLNLAAGIRGFVSEALSIGAEFGWGFLNVSADQGEDVFTHDIFGALLIDASVGL